LIDAFRTKHLQSLKATLTLGALALLNIAGFCYFLAYLRSNGYLPSPFVYDKSDTFMDLFNTLYWAYDDGRYTEWGSVYPPLTFTLLRGVNFLVGGTHFGDAYWLRDHSPGLLVALFALYLVAPAIVLRTRPWGIFTTEQKVLLYLSIAVSAPMLFALERGNLILLCPILLAFAISKIGFTRSLCIALLVNIKPYFVLLLLYYLARRDFRGFFLCSFLCLLTFLLTALPGNDNFLLFFANLFGFAQNSATFSLREVLALPSTVSAFSYVLENPDGANFASGFLAGNSIQLISNAIEFVKWTAITCALLALWGRAHAMRDSEILAMLVVVIANVGVWVGGYSFVLYATVIPVLIVMRARILYVAALTLIAIPIDLIPLKSDFLPAQDAFLSQANVEIYWTLGLGSVVRPLVNLLLLSAMTREMLTRHRKGHSARARNGNSPIACSTGEIVANA